MKLSISFYLFNLENCKKKLTNLLKLAILEFCIIFFCFQHIIETNKQDVL
jgi:hypothetical protein